MFRVTPRDPGLAAERAAWRLLAAAALDRSLVLRPPPGPAAPECAAQDIRTELDPVC